MKVLLVYTNINGFHEDYYSPGLASIVSITKMYGHKVKVEIISRKKEYLKLLDIVTSFNPKIVGFSSVSSQFNFVKEISALVKERNSNIITVCGGVHPTINTECILEAKSLDGCFVGESENSFIEFIKKIENDEDYKNTDNFVYIEDGKLIVNKLKPLITNLDSFPYPDREIYPFEDNLKRTGYAHFIFSRGCPYLCSYCSNHALAKKYNLPRNYSRYRSPESSIREIEETIKRFQINTIAIGDDVFGLDKKWRDEFCKKYKERIRIRFFCLLRPNLVDEEIVRLLKDTGCYRISIGIESGNEYIRKNILNRQMSNDQIANAFAIAKKCGVLTNAINIIGIPGETEEMIRDTIKLNRKVKPTSSGVNIFYPYKGTKLGDYCFKNNLVNEDAYSIFSNERRETVLNYPIDYKKKLAYYRANWESLVYRFDWKRFLSRSFRKTFIWKYLRKLKFLIPLRSPELR